MDVVIGLRVVRGPDWECGEEDGGEGYVGTVMGVGEGRSVEVQWDCGERGSYRCGEGGKYDLRVFDSGPAGIKHLQTECEWCRETAISGIVWKCVCCLDYYLCSKCYMAGRHSVQHPFRRSDSKDLSKQTQVPWRMNARKVEARGIFPGAEVVRGRDWRWGDQDGGLGMVGKVLTIKGWGKESRDRSVAEVQWAALHRSKVNVYRVGFKGKVDLKCTVKGSGSGSNYYPDHLPVLGVPYEPPSPTEFATGDTVIVELDIEILRLMQEGHGGWNDSIAEFLGSTGMINSILESGDLLVRYANNTVFVFNPEIVTKVDTPYLTLGSMVRVVDDIAKVHDFQQKSGVGWVDDMALCLGQVGRVMKQQANGNFLVRVNGKRWLFCPQSLVPAPEVQPSFSPDEDDVDVNARVQVLAIVSERENPDGIPYAAAAGDVSLLQQLLDKYPQEVNRMAKGKAAIHAACVESYATTLKVLMQYKPDLEMMDTNGERALHICAYINNEEAAKVLFDAGADVNSRSIKEDTPLMVAAAVGHYPVLKYLLQHPQIDLCAQDVMGSTALHCAVIAQRNKSVTMLLEAGADPSLIDFDCTTSIHSAAGFGLLPAMEQFIAHYPQYINIQKPDGYTPLHIAAANNHPDVAAFLAQQRSCNLNLRTAREGLTPLHIAVHEGYSAFVEVLVGCGADINAATSDRGNTSLHIAIARKNMRTPCVKTPQLLKIKADLEAQCSGFRIEPYVVVACFLVQEGGDMHMKNMLGQSPFQICSSDVGTLISTFVQKHGRGTFHRSLRNTSDTGSLPTAKKRTVTLRHQMEKHHNQAGSTATPQASGTTLYTLNERAKNMNMDVKKELGKDLNQSSQNNAQSSKPTYEVSSTDKLGVCCLCDKNVDAKLAPCGHAVMCLLCAHMAKLCPTCKIPIQTVSAIQ